MPTAQRTSVQQLTTTEAAVLALLAIEGERSGYDLMKAVTQAIGHIWSPARSGLYAALPRLVKLGLARAARSRSRRARQAASTASRRPGRRALDAWLETVEPGARDTFFLKLFVGGLTTPDVLLAPCRAVHRRLRGCGSRSTARSSATNTNRGHDWYHRHLLRHGLERTEQELAWADGVARALRRGPR